MKKKKKIQVQGRDDKPTKKEKKILFRIRTEVLQKEPKSKPKDLKKKRKVKRQQTFRKKRRKKKQVSKRNLPKPREAIEIEAEGPKKRN